ncbi:MAG: T9SS type A sorting domain-containing protein, partial [Chlorobi bacterium]|nr:T9SS type A sorting domain-containing protein [Chlorobiota bacterium]MCI0716720.1 T9SS type A sorting domain-containing protein [Chlorobiota bacterium]
KSMLRLEYNSLVTMYPGSKIIIEYGAWFCDYGARYGGSGGQIIRRSRDPYSPCSDKINIVYDSIQYILEDSAVVIIPDSSIITFDSTSKFIMNPYSQLRIGKNSKVVFKNGSRIFANNCKFASLDSTQTWDGIYLSGISYDTLKNCVIENAYNGINIEDKVNPGIGDPPATEISSCTFKSTTSTNLLNYVYVNNSQNVLIKSCSSVVTSSGKFTSGIITEYCPSNGVIIVDNNINNVTTGISVIQSSPYIARNTITGQTSTGKGIYLDNSNGTIEYNIINNFDISIQFLYSSPYLLKNTLNDADEINVGIKTSSVPVMRPVISGSTLLWLGGNNYLNGEPTEAAITLESSAYPLIDSGYNVTNTTSTFSISGELDNNLQATMNYWANPEFDVTGGTVYYEPRFDGPLPSTDYYNLNSLGFGLYDTVYVKDLGDNPTAQSLFMQAYNKEMVAEYEDAIALYKEVVSEYKSSSFAPVSLSRIFNCLEKNNSSYSDYQTIYSYYSNIKNSSAYPTETRDLAEDFTIKSKVKRNLIEEAIADYHTIYQNNQNNSKGQHALVNELCLIQMTEGGDNPNGGGSVEKHKYDILSLIIGKDVRNSNVTNNNIPFAYKLYQNYPNPFNPVTTIKYDIPQDNFVSIKIYDLLGREIFTFSEFKKAGSYEVKFDGSGFASGLYFYKIEAGPSTGSGLFTETKKMVLIK